MLKYIYKKKRNAYLHYSPEKKKKNKKKNRRVELNWLSKPGQRLIMISVPCNFTFPLLDLLIVSGNVMAGRIK